MLGDTAEKTKNPLKKAMRRRNAKTVQFAAPTYVEASDYDYSSDEDDDQDDSFEGISQETQGEAKQNGQEPETEDALAVQPLKINGSKKEVKSSADSFDTSRDSTDESLKDSDKQRTSDEIFDRPRKSWFKGRGGWNAYALQWIQKYHGMGRSETQTPFSKMTTQKHGRLLLRQIFSETTQAVQPCGLLR